MADERARDEDPYADEPDRWEDADREWEEKWSDKPTEAVEIKPPPEAHRPEKASARSVAGSYQKGMQEAGPYLTLGLQIAGAMVLFAGGGIAVDRWLDTSPWGVIVGAALGFVGVMALVVRLAREPPK